MMSKEQKEFQLELFISRVKTLQNDILDLTHSGFSLANMQTESKTSEILQSFPEQLLSESEDMSECYQLLYCFENDVRKIVNDVMNENFGTTWWEQKVRPKIKDEVKKRQDAEQKSVYYGRIDDPLYFTTLGELKEILIDNYNEFTNHFRSDKFVEEILFQINRLRIVVGHNCMLEEMDVTTLKQYIERWYTIK